ncbi:MAG: helix-turn-helix transcriptional regulator [Alphaproteobacteria bacterium]|nr:helix-turn-helix transcriptional regulator [Alphaproteobacteria bacterium]
MEERLKKIRENLKKTQKEMSAFLGLGEITWQNYERGISKPKLATMEKLALLGYNIAWVTTGNGNMFVSNIHENTDSNFEVNNSIDKTQIFNLLLTELEKIYSKEILLSKPHNFISIRAFEMTMNIANLADNNATAINMVKLMLIEEQNKINS